jgi:hypothetical protein
LKKNILMNPFRLFIIQYIFNPSHSKLKNRYERPHKKDTT